MRVLGNCSAALKHRGTMTLEANPLIDPPTHELTVINNQNVEDFYSTQRVSNWESTYNTTTNSVEGGFAGIFNGVVYIDNVVTNQIINNNSSTVIDLDDVVEIEVVRDVRLADVAGTWKLQKRTQTVAVLKAYALSAWTDVHSFAKCDFLVENVTWDTAGNKKIQQVRVPDVVVVSKGAAATSDVLTATVMARVLEDTTYANPNFTETYRQNVYVFAVGASGADTVFTTEAC